MKEYIKNKLNEQFKVYQKVDYSLNNKHNNELKRKYVCNVLSVKTIEEGIDLLNKAIGTKYQNPEDWNKIQKTNENVVRNNKPIERRTKNWNDW